MERGTPVSGSRQLQGRERLDGPRVGRPAARRGGRAAQGNREARRHGGTPRGRRVRRAARGGRPRRSGARRGPDRRGPRRPLYSRRSPAWWERGGIGDHPRDLCQCERGDRDERSDPEGAWTTPAGCRPCDVPGEGPGQGSPRGLRREDGRGSAQAPRRGEQVQEGRGVGGDPGLLPAEGLARGRRGDRYGGAGPLGGPGARPRAPFGVYSPGRGDRPHRLHGGGRDAAGVPYGGRVAARAPRRRPYGGLG